MSRPIRILHFTWRLTRGGGIPVVIRAFLRRMNPTRFENHVCTVRPNRPEDGLEELGQHHAYHPLGLEGALGARARLSVTRQVLRLTRSLRPDLLHTHSGVAWYTVPGALGCRSLRGRILEVHDSPQSGRVTRLNNAVEGAMVRRLGYSALVHSSDVRRGVAAHAGVPETAVVQIPLGIDTEGFGTPSTAPSRWRSQHQIPERAPVVLYVARVVPTKNVPLFLEVAEQVLAVRGDAVFVLVGGGSELDRLRSSRVAVERPGSIRLLGPRFGAELVDAYHGSDVFLSTSDYEGFGLAVVEAMAAGKPVVSTAAGGVADLIVEGQTGHFGPVGAAGPLAAAVLRLLEAPAQARALGEAGRARARAEFDTGVMVRRFEAYYEALLG